MKQRQRPWTPLAALLGAMALTAAALASNPAPGERDPPTLVELTPAAEAARAPFVRATPLATSAGARATLETIETAPTIQHIRVGRASPTLAVATRSFTLELGKEHGTLRVENLQHRHEDGIDHLYHLDIEARREISLVVEGPDVSGWIRTSERTWSLVPLGDGATAVAEHDLSRRPYAHMHDEPRPADPDTPRNKATAPEALSAARRALAAEERGETMIDVLVVFTEAARTVSGNAAGSMRMLLARAFADTNRIFENSGLDTRLRLVHAEQTAYVESDWNGTDLCYLRTTATTGGEFCAQPPSTPKAPDSLDEAHALRDAHGADLVMLINGVWNGAGIATKFAGTPEGAYSVVNARTEREAGYAVAHELGHNLDGAHNPAHAYPALVSYAYGRCNTEDNWNTVMSYADDGPPDHNECRWQIPLLAGPRVVGPKGRPTGDTTTHDVVRRFTETTPIVAGFRTAVEAPTTHHLVPFVPKTNAANGLHAFVRVINRSTASGTVTITATDDAGDERTTWLEIEASSARHFNSRDLEAGGVKGLGPGIGPSALARRLTLSSNLDLKVLAYARTADGFVTSLHETAPKWTTGAGQSALVEFFNPGSNRRIASHLRIINLEDRTTRITVHGYDDAMTLTGPDRQPSILTPPIPERRRALFDMAPRTARNLASWTLEQGMPDAWGNLGEGKGKWTIVVHAEGTIEVMSLLYNDAGYLTNVSR